MGYLTAFVLLVGSFVLAASRTSVDGVVLLAGVLYIVGTILLVHVHLHHRWDRHDDRK